MSALPSELHLNQCDREPIHLLGGIQPHGVLLAFHGVQRTLAVVSANIQGLLDRAPEALLGLPLAQVLPTPVLAWLDASAPPGSTRVELQGRAFRALTHESDGFTVLELEPADADLDSEERALAWVQQLIAPLPGVRGTQALLQSTAEAVQAITGFDRVMVYRFDTDWHGEVLAESRRDGMDSFLGTHFPASDIPAQARALYTRNPLRLIADAGAAPVPLLPPVLPGRQGPLDLSGAALRSVSPVHLEYLRNMGVGASFSLSLLKDGVLWGLIACHHLSALHVRHERRRACEVLTRLLALQLSAEERAAEAVEQARRAALLGRLAMELKHESALRDALPSHGAEVLGVTGASGAALLLGEAPVLVGDTPSAAQVEALATWLTAQPFRTIFHTERLGEVYPPLAGSTDVAAGLLAVRLDPLRAASGALVPSGGGAHPHLGGQPGEASGGLG